MSAIITTEAGGERSVLVTGGTSGLGRSLVSELMRRGWHVVFTGRNVAAGEALERASGVGGGTCHFLPLDQSDLLACLELPQRIAALGMPPLTAIACNAGTHGRRSRNDGAGTRRDVRAQPPQPPLPRRAAPSRPPGRWSHPRRLQRNARPGPANRYASAGVGRRLGHGRARLPRRRTLRARRTDPLHDLEALQPALRLPSSLSASAAMTGGSPSMPWIPD